MMEKILACIVVYNPDYKRLEENILSIINQVSTVILVVNGKQDTKIDEFLKLDKVVGCYLGENKGIAFALNYAFEYAKKNDYSWCLTLDQDSLACDGLIECYMNYINEKDIGVLTCNIIDQNMGRISKNIGLEEVDFCITSGSLVRISAYEEIGGFDNDLFIDKVDLDFCLNIKKTNYKIIKVEYDGLLHEIGSNARTIHFLFRSHVIFSHGPFRRYYISRNAIIIAKKHRMSIFKAIISNLYDILAVFIYEDKKISKLKASIRGMHDGMRYKL